MRSSPSIERILNAWIDNPLTTVVDFEYNVYIIPLLVQAPEYRVETWQVESLTRMRKNHCEYLRYLTKVSSMVCGKLAGMSIITSEARAARTPDYSQALVRC